MPRSRRRFSRELKVQILNEVAAGKSIAQAAREYDVHPVSICKWRKDYETNPERAFPGNGKAASDEAKIAQLERMVGRLTMENDLLKKAIERTMQTKK